MSKEANEQTGNGFVIEEVTDFERGWSEIEPLVLGQIEYHRAWDSRRLRGDWPTRMREFMASHGVTLLAIEGSRAAVGFINGDVSRDFGIFQEVSGHINNAFVTDDARSRGIGTALLERFEAWCQEQGADEVRLEVTEGNDLGLRFWRRSGYEVAMHEMRKPLEVPA